MSNRKSIVALVLAAGQSLRFGGDKLLHPLDGKPLAAHVADTLAGLDFTHRIAICPVGGGRRDVFSMRGFEVIGNADPGRGMASSLALGAERAMALDADAMLVCLADMPFVTRAHLGALMDAEGDLVATEADGVRSPPALFGRTLLAKLIGLSGDQGARHLLMGARLISVAPAMVRDFDQRSDFGEAG